MELTKERKNERVKQIKVIEGYLRNYKNFKAGLSTMREQLEFIMPDITASYEVQEGTTGTFNIKSDTEKYAIDRIESKRALVLHEDIARYELIINSIKEATESLDDLEQEYVKLRYFERFTMQQVSIELGYSEKRIFNLRNEVMDKLLISLKGLLQL